MADAPSVQESPAAWSGPLARQAVELRDSLAQIAGNPSIDKAVAGLSDALGALRSDRPRPVIAVLLGGTGAGKSMLFSALLEQPGASPSSDAIRCHTSAPYIAVHPEDEPFLGELGGWKATRVRGPSRGVVLVDTPDVDGILKEHHAATRALLERADLVVFVTDADRRANRDLLAELSRWAPRHRWFFVLNKADQHAGRIREIVSDWDSRLREAGFEPDDRSRFAVSSVVADDPGLGRLRSALLRERDGRQVVLSRNCAFLQTASHAMGSHLDSALDRMIGDLGRREAEANARLRDAYASALREPQARRAFLLVTRQAAWRHLAERAGFPLGWAAWVCARAQGLATGMLLGRAIGSGAGVLGLGLALAGGGLVALRGLLPFRRVVESLGSDFRRLTASLERDIRRDLEDIGVEKLAERPMEAPSSPEPGDAVGAIAAQVDSLVRRFWTRGLDADLMAQVESDVEQAASTVARGAVGGLAGFVALVVGNALPLLLGGWVLIRLWMAWYEANYPSFGFYTIGLSLLAASFLPGLFLLTMLLGARLNRLDVAGLVALAEQPRPTDPLRRAREGLEARRRDARRLSQSAVNRLEEVRGELDALGMGLSRRLMPPE